MTTDGAVPEVAATFENPATYGIRLDSGFEAGSEVGTHYDAMLAKVVAWGPTRDEALRRLAGTLARARIHGLRTNRDLLVEVLRHDAVVEGDVSTDFFDRHEVQELAGREYGWGSVVPSEVSAHAAALALADHDVARRRVQRRVPVAWRNVPSQPQLTRFAVGRPDADAGISIRLDESDPQSVVIRFFDTKGADLIESGQRKIERLFLREDFRRVFPGEIGDIGFPPRHLEHYSTALEAAVDVERIAASNFKVVVDYAYGAASFVMPNVLSKLGADVLAVNPFTSTAGVMSWDRDEHAAAVGRLVRASAASLGAVFDPGGEHLTLVDDAGHVLSDDEALLAFVALVSSDLDEGSIALPLSVTSHADGLAARNGVDIVRTKLSPAALMQAASEPGVAFGADGSGGFILPRFLPAFDGAAAMVKMLELLATEETSLSKVVATLPAVHIERETVVTPWEQKGTVMRSLVELSKDREVELVDGVKVHHDGGWALALPDPEEPVTHVWAEAGSSADARRLAQEYARRIRQLLR